MCKHGARIRGQCSSWIVCFSALLTWWLSWGKKDANELCASLGCMLVTASTARTQNDAKIKKKHHACEYSVVYLRCSLCMVYLHLFTYIWMRFGENVDINIPYMELGWVSKIWHSANPFLLSLIRSTECFFFLRLNSHFFVNVLIFFPYPTKNGP